jgi:hypothetical protein
MNDLRNRIRIAAMPTALLVVSCGVFASCGYSAEEMQVKQDRIDNLENALDRLQAEHERAMARLRAHLDEFAEQAEAACSQTPAVPDARSATAPSPSPTVPPGEATVEAHFEGRGSLSTRPFTTGGPWRLRWTISGSGGSRALFVLRTSTGELVAIIAKQQGDGSGETYVPRAGSFFLEVAADGAWRLEISRMEH